MMHLSGVASFLALFGRNAHTFAISTLNGGVQL